jgi:PEP-CTERM motif-containing protein
MRLLRNFTVVALALTALAVMPRSADAALLTIIDGTDVWTLNVQDACSTCAIQLGVTYSASSARLGDNLQGVQWSIDSPNVVPTTIGFTGTTAGSTSDWTFDYGVVSSGGCNPNANGDACGQWVGAGVGFPVAIGTYSWSFSSQFASTLGTLVSGRMRAAYDVDPDGPTGPLRKNFSPDTTNFGGGGSTGGGGATVPEPVSMLLFGAGALATAYRARRRGAR